jgi:hypothetical protein
MTVPPDPAPWKCERAAICLPRCPCSNAAIASVVRKLKPVAVGFRTRVAINPLSPFSEAADHRDRVGRRQERRHLDTLER